jgi:hypothetical protein
MSKQTKDIAKKMGRASDITGKGTFKMTGRPNGKGDSYQLGYTSNPSAFRKHSQGWRPNDIKHEKIKTDKNS